MKTKGSKPVEHHDELDIIDSLGLTDDKPPVRLKHILLDRSSESDSSKEQLKNVLNGRMDEGNGEALFDAGLEDSGESMGFSKEEWELALERIRECVTDIKAEIRILMTRNLGSDMDIETSSKDQSCSGKLLIRRIPKDLDEVIETRIAVVGNGE